MKYLYLTKGIALTRHYRKILLIMKLTAFLIILSLAQISAKTLAQNLTIKVKNASAITVLNEISAKSKYLFVYDERVLKQTPKITLDLTDKSINEILDNTFKNSKISYFIRDRYITLKTTEETFFDKANQLIKNILQNITVRGRVVDENNSPLAGAKVTIKGTKRSTVTNSNGYFELQNVDETGTILIEYLGYGSLELKAKEITGEVKLTVSHSNLAEVQINAGYYTVTDRERTGSISRITSADIEKQPVNNLLAAMQANIPGVQIVQNTGVPGGGFSILIRGRNSLISGNDPFYVIDGVPYSSISLAGSRSFDITPNANPLASINPSNIESIEVLKDADATAIYGSRGANGVVLITTKTGKAGKATASVTVTKGISRVGKRMDLMDTKQYLDMRNQAFDNDGLTPGITDYDVNGTWEKLRYTDWQKELIGANAPTTNILASLSGGTINIAYLIGGNYYKEGTVFPSDNTYGRNSGNFSLQYTSDNKKLLASADANYSQINSNLFPTDLTRFIFLTPNYPELIGENGSINWQNDTMIDNPIANTRQTYNAKTNTLIANGMLSYAVVTDLKLKATFGYTKTDRDELSTYPLTTISPIAYDYSPSSRRSYFANNSIDTWILETQANWIKNIGSGKLDVLFGSTLQQSLTDIREVKGASYTSDVLLGNIASASVLSIQNSIFTKYRYSAIYGRLNYNFKEKYFINATGRRDGSSRFGIGNRLANFGAIGAAWIISEERFIKNHMPFFSFLKLRGSYGITGNDRISDYGYLELWNSPFNGNYQGNSTLFPKQLSNPDYGWEINRKAEGALDLAILENKVALSISYYSSKSSNQLLNRQLAPSTGFTSIYDNLPAVVGNTGWEIEMNTKNISSKSFQWKTSFNLTMPKNKLISYPNFENSPNAALFAIGHPLSITKLTNSYIDPLTGLYVAEDSDENGVIDIADQYIIKFIGRRYYGGLQNSFILKGIQLDFLFQFVKQSGLSTLSALNPPGLAFLTEAATYNQPIQSSNNWRKAGDDAQYQKYSTSYESLFAYRAGTSQGRQMVSDASFIRLKNVSLSYIVPRKLLQKIHIQNLKVFLQSQNMLTFTSYNGLDPETQSLANLPSLQSFTTGVQITF